MPETDKRNIIAQWAFDTRPVLLRFHLWLEDVEVERAQAEPVSAMTFTPRGIARCLAMTSAATALGTRLFGDFGAGAGKDKAAYNQVKKAADAISAYVMSEGLWHLTRTLPENHAIMVSLGEGLMPKAGETPEMGANPLLGFGRVYARPEVARLVDRRVRRLLNEPGHTFEQFHGWLQDRGITLWGAAVDTLENTSRFAEGKPTGPMAVFHLFDSPLKVTRPYESYMGCLTIPRRVRRGRRDAPRSCSTTARRARKVVEAIEGAYPGIRARATSTSGRCAGRAASRGSASSGTSGRRSAPTSSRTAGRRPRASRCSPTRAPTRRRSSSAAGRTPPARRTSSSATATRRPRRRCRRRASPRCSTWTRRCRRSRRASSCRARTRARRCSSTPTPGLRRAARARCSAARDIELGKVEAYAEAIREARSTNLPLAGRVLRADDLMPQKDWSVLASVGYMCRRPVHRARRA